MTRIVNLTPHVLRIMSNDGTVVLELPAATVPARLSQTVGTRSVLADDRIPLHTISYGDPTGLPDPTPDTVLVVSRTLAEHTDRDDLVFPDDEVRDPTGRIIGCRALAHLARSGCSDQGVRPQ